LFIKDTLLLYYAVDGKKLYILCSMILIEIYTNNIFFMDKI